MGKYYLQHLTVIHMLKRDKNIITVGSWIENNISEIILWQTLLAASPLSLTPLLPSWQGRGIVWVLTHSVLREVSEC